MTKTAEIVLFCMAFLSQILLVSWFYIRGVIRDRRYVLRSFPATTHPKLYPQPVAYYERKLRNIERVNLVMMTAGLLIIAAIVGALFGAWDGGVFNPSRDQDWDALIVIPFFVVQMITATAYLELSMMKHLKAMTLAPPPRVRTTELHRRRLTDFVSPAMLGVAALTNVGFVAFLLDYRRHEFPWFTAIGNIVGLVFMCSMFFCTVAYALYAPRPDPYLANQDRRAWLGRAVQGVLTLCIVYPVLITVTLVIKTFDTNILEPFVVSLYCQGCALAMLWPRFRVDQIDFDVYRRDERAPTAADASASLSSS